MQVWRPLGALKVLEAVPCRACLNPSFSSFPPTMPQQSNNNAVNKATQRLTKLLQVPSTTEGWKVRVSRQSSAWHHSCFCQSELWQESEAQRWQGISFEDIILLLPQEKRRVWAEFLEVQAANISKEPDISEVPPPAAPTQKPTKPKPRPVVRSRAEQTLEEVSGMVAELSSVYKEVHPNMPLQALDLFDDLSEVLREGGPLAQIMADMLESWSARSVG
jgi:hypothetical protein